MGTRTCSLEKLLFSKAESANNNYPGCGDPAKKGLSCEISRRLLSVGEGGKVCFGVFVVVEEEQVVSVVFFFFWRFKLVKKMASVFAVGYHLRSCSLQEATSSETRRGGLLSSSRKKPVDDDK